MKNGLFDEKVLTTPSFYCPRFHLFTFLAQVSFVDKPTHTYRRERTNARVQPLQQHTESGAQTQRNRLLLSFTLHCRCCCPHAHIASEECPRPPLHPPRKSTTGGWIRGA